MEFITKAEAAEWEAERQRIREEIVGTIDWTGCGGISELSMLRAGWMTLVEEADRRIAENVAQLRFMGASWTEIGAGLGISKQAAQQRFG